MATFGNREQAPMNSKPGDYILRVVGYEKGLSRGGKTSGADKYTLKCLVETTGSRVQDRLIITDEDFCAARVDCFLKSTGQVLQDGESFSFDQEEAEANGWKHIPLLGLRGWGSIRYQPMTAEQAAKVAHLKPAQQEEMQYNEVVRWITNKEKLPRHIAPAAQQSTPPVNPEPTADNPDWS